MKTIDRRELIMASAAVIAVPFAGCLDGDGSDTTPVNGGETVDEEQASYHIDTAMTEMQTAIDDLAEHVENDEELALTAYNDSIDTARNELDDAEAIATDDQKEDIDDLRDLLEYLSLRGEMEESISQAFDVHLDDGVELYWEAREQFDQDPLGVDELKATGDSFVAAKDEFSLGDQEFRNVFDLIDDSQGVIEEMGFSVLDEFDNISSTMISQDRDDIVWFIIQMSTFTTGLVEGSRGWSHITDGFIVMENEDWEEVEDNYFELANDAMVAGWETVEEADTDTLDFLEVYFGDMMCEFETGVTATEYWIDASEAGQDGDGDKLSSLVDDGWDAIAACDE